MEEFLPRNDSKLHHNIPGRNWRQDIHHGDAIDFSDEQACSLPLGQLWNDYHAYHLSPIRCLRWSYSPLIDHLNSGNSALLWLRFVSPEQGFEERG